MKHNNFNPIQQALYDAICHLRIISDEDMSAYEEVLSDDLGPKHCGQYNCHYDTNIGWTCNHCGTELGPSECVPPRLWWPKAEDTTCYRLRDGRGNEVEIVSTIEEAQHFVTNQLEDGLACSIEVVS